MELQNIHINKYIFIVCLVLVSKYYSMSMQGLNHIDYFRKQFWLSKQCLPLFTTMKQFYILNNLFYSLILRSSSEKTFVLISSTSSSTWAQKTINNKRRTVI